MTLKNLNGCESCFDGFQVMYQYNKYKSCKSINKGIKNGIKDIIKEYCRVDSKERRGEYQYLWHWEHVLICFWTQEVIVMMNGSVVDG